jgi:hypothetical protein
MSAGHTEEARDLLKDISRLAQKELFDHPVQESVLTSDIDYITLGWTRLLQAVIDLAPQDELDGLIPMYKLLTPVC